MVGLLAINELIWNLFRLLDMLLLSPVQADLSGIDVK